MSNPGVINLFSFFKRSGIIKRFQIEDNIGESIHIHVNNFRIDLTIKEFYRLVDSLRENCKELQKPIDMLKEYSIDPLGANVSFGSMQFKIVLNSTNSSRVPQLKDFRAIAAT